MPKKNKKGALGCSCGYVQKEAEQSKITESLKPADDIAVVDVEMDPSPLIEVECPNCGNNEARFWTAQTRAGDEPETKFYKCEKCKHTWRDYS